MTTDLDTLLDRYERLIRNIESALEMWAGLDEDTRQMYDAQLDEMLVVRQELAEQAELASSPIDPRVIVLDNRLKMSEDRVYKTFQFSVGEFLEEMNQPGTKDISALMR